jgi:metal-dependent amidase/aminoacylase/carboxypeptidase family protein
VRALAPEARDLAEIRLKALVTGIASSFGATATIDYGRGYPVTSNHDKNTEHAIAAAMAVASEAQVDPEVDPVMGAEDFSYMLNERPGAFMFIGNGPSAGLHHPRFDFNDAILPSGIAYWSRLAEQRLS